MVLAPADFLRSADNRRRLARCMAGLACCGVGFASLVKADLGLDPWDVFHQGAGERLGLPIGTVSILTGLVVLLGWIPLRERPGLGTVLNVLTIGSVMDLVIPRIPDQTALPGRWGMLLGGIIVAGIGIGLYIGAGLGPGPRDGLMTGIAKRRGSIRAARTLIELCALIIGWLLGGHVGVGTLVFAVTIGPAAHESMKRLSLPPRDLASALAIKRSVEPPLVDPSR